MCKTLWWLITVTLWNVYCRENPCIPSSLFRLKLLFLWFIFNSVQSFICPEMPDCLAIDWWHHKPLFLELILFSATMEKYLPKWTMLQLPECGHRKPHLAHRVGRSTEVLAILCALLPYRPVEGEGSVRRAGLRRVLLIREGMPSDLCCVPCLRFQQEPVRASWGKPERARANVTVRRNNANRPLSDTGSPSNRSSWTVRRSSMTRRQASISTDARWCMLCVRTWGIKYVQLIMVMLGALVMGLFNGILYIWIILLNRLSIELLMICPLSVWLLAFSSHRIGIGRLLWGQL